MLTRDLADVASDVGDIAVGIKHAGKWLGDAYADGATEKIRPAIRELYRARAELNKLIGELETHFADTTEGGA